MAANGIGAALKRKEDPRLITGSAVYTDDIQLPGMLYAHFVRSPYAHARIVSIDTAAALAVPGVAGVYTFSDLQPYFKAPLPCAWAAYPRLKNPPHSPLAPGVARYVGDPVAVVVAESRHAARDAADQVLVEYESLPVVVDLEAALQPDAPRVHADLPDNISFTFDFATPGVQAAFAGADVVVCQRHWQQRLVPNAMERRAVMAEWRRCRPTIGPATSGSSLTWWSRPSCWARIWRPACPGRQRPPRRNRPAMAAASASVSWLPWPPPAATRQPRPAGSAWAAARSTASSGNTASAWSGWPARAETPPGT